MFNFNTSSSWIGTFVLSLKTKITIEIYKTAIGTLWKSSKNNILKSKASQTIFKYVTRWIYLLQKYLNYMDYAAVDAFIFCCAFGKHIGSILFLINAGKCYLMSSTRKSFLLGISFEMSTVLKLVNGQNGKYKIL